ncbi:MAG: methyltransferase domain-containing protein [Verrucomicrobia bacterium]|nr:methyltransferase domain-containing protein [Verrucomicrobiota bacterium]MCF7708340.1 methyltransferase domain-containing protein [Verrucomicrobiota bacterium]
MSHQQTYTDNKAYADFLSDWDTDFFAKYTDTLINHSGRGERVLDAGCGVGQALKRLVAADIDAYGVDVSKPNIERAKVICGNCSVYDGKVLPFTDGFFRAAGAFNVLEHVEEPELFLSELCRVVKPGGWIVVSSPNFFRAAGLGDYHPRMRGIRNKLKNLRRILQKRRVIRRHPEQVRFDRIQPIQRAEFHPDDDAIIATNGIEIRFFLEQYGCDVVSSECTDRYVNPLLDRLLNLTPARHLILNIFTTARKRD